jgi:putative peptidoglycan lipid II flippase
MKKIFRPQQAGIAALFVSVATFLSTALGLVRDKVMAHYFGASLETDFYNYGYTIPDMLQNILIMGVTSSSFIPVFAEHVAQCSREEANRMASSFLNITLCVFTAICLLVGLFMSQIVEVWLGPDFPAEEKAGVIDVTRIFLLAQIFFAVSKIFSGILQTHKHFTAYALALIVYNPAIILGMALFHQQVGIYSAAYGALIGAGLVALVNLADLMRTQYRYQWTWQWGATGIRQVYLLAIPNFLNLALLQVVILAYSRLSVDLQEGSYSAFRYALNFESFPVSLFGISFVTAIFPYLAENVGQRNFDNFNYNVQNSFRQILYLTLPAGLGMAVLSDEIIGLVLSGGQFDAEDVRMTGGILFFYALAVPLESLWYLYARAFYSLKDTWTPFWYRLIGTVINLTISYMLAFRIGPSAFSLGILVAFAIQIGFFTVGLKKRVVQFDIRQVWHTSYKLVACAAIMMALVLTLNRWLADGPWLASYSLRMQYLMRTVLGIGLGAVSYVGLTVLFRCADFSVLNRVTGRLFKK